MARDRVMRLIREYHEKYHPDQIDMTPLTATADLLEFRRMLFAEEAKESLDAWDEGNISHLIHELADVVIVALGTAMRLNVDLDEVMAVVLEAGMQKIPNPDPSGKAIKPPGYVPADAAVRRIVEKAG